MILIYLIIPSVATHKVDIYLHIELKHRPGEFEINMKMALELVMEMFVEMVSEVNMNMSLKRYVEMHVNRSSKYTDSSITN